MVKFNVKVCRGHGTADRCWNFSTDLDYLSYLSNLSGKLSFLSFSRDSSRSFSKNSYFSPDCWKKTYRVKYILLLRPLQYTVILNVFLCLWYPLYDHFSLMNTCTCKIGWPYMKFTECNCLMCSVRGFKILDWMTRSNEALLINNFKEQVDSFWTKITFELLCRIIPPFVPSYFFPLVDVLS